MSLRIREYGCWHGGAAEAFIRASVTDLICYQTAAAVTRVDTREHRWTRPVPQAVRKNLQEPARLGLFVQRNQISVHRQKPCRLQLWNNAAVVSGPPLDGALCSIKVDLQLPKKNKNKKSKTAPLVYRQP